MTLKIQQFIFFVILPCWIQKRSSCGPLVYLRVGLTLCLSSLLLSSNNTHSSITPGGCHCMSMIITLISGQYPVLCFSWNLEIIFDGSRWRPCLLLLVSIKIGLHYTALLAETDYYCRLVCSVPTGQPSQADKLHKLIRHSQISAKGHVI